jgi:acyl-CoA thioester hydrolase
VTGPPLKLKIYYADTDCGGVVYYANYLRYFEQARTEFLEAGGVNLRQLMNEGIIFVVAEAHLKYLAPGRYGDILLIESSVDKIGAASVIFHHRVTREKTGEPLAEGTVKLVCVGRDMKPVRLRSSVIEALKGHEG